MQQVVQQQQLVVLQELMQTCQSRQSLRRRCQYCWQRSEMRQTDRMLLLPVLLLPPMLPRQARQMDRYRVLRRARQRYQLNRWKTRRCRQASCLPTLTARLLQAVRVLQRLAAAAAAAAATEQALPLVQRKKHRRLLEALALSICQARISFG